MLKKIHLFAFFSVFCTSTAFAVVSSNDFISSYFEPPPQSFAQGNWNGVYLGAGSGFVLGTTDTNYSAVDNADAVTSGNKVNLAAGHAFGFLGYSQTINRFYWAGELDAGSYFGTGGATSTATSNGITTSTLQTPTWSVTPSLIVGGLPRSQFLIYGRFGIPMLGMDSTATTSGVTTTNNNQFNIGLLLGLGVGYSFTPHFQVRVEDDVSHVWEPDSVSTNNLTFSSQTNFNELLGTVAVSF